MIKTSGVCQLMATVTLCTSCYSLESDAPSPGPSVEFQVESTTPPDGLRDVGRAGPFLVRFSDEADPSSVRVTLTPAAELTFKYSGASNREFTYEAATLLAPRTSYVARVEAASLRGRGLPSPYTFAFTTGDEPLLDSELTPTVGLAPPDGSVGVELAPTLRLSFSKPMDRESVEGALRIEPAVECGTLTWGAEGTGLECAVARQLTPSTTYTVSLAATARRANDGPALGQPFSSTFTTRPPPSVSSVSPEEGAIVPSVDGTVSIIFDVWPTPIDEGSLKKAFRYVSPAGHEVSEASCFFERCTLRTNAPFAERETITWQLSTEAHDGDGVPIAEAASGSFTTGRRATTLLQADPLADGTVAGGAVDTANARMTVGRTAQGPSRAFLSFDLGQLPPTMLELSSARLRMTHDATVGTPSGLGSLLVYSVAYGEALTAGAFDGAVHTYRTCNLLLQCHDEAFDAGLVPDAGALWSALVSSHVQRDLGAGAEKSQFRIQFRNDAAAGGTGGETFFSANQAASAPKLEVVYWEP